MFTLYPHSRELEEDTEQKKGQRQCKKLRIPPIFTDKIIQHVV